MRILVDENLGHALAEALRRAGNDVITTALSYRGLSDEDIGEAGVREGRVVVTEDVNFARALGAGPARDLGVIVIRLHRLSKQARLERAVEAISTLRSDLGGQIAIIEATAIRIGPIIPRGVRR